MDLGSFSVSLAVKDIKASRWFYERLGFQVIDGEEDQSWLVLQNGEAKIGLYEGVFEGNLLTFINEDVRSLERKLKAAGFPLMREINGEVGPGHVVIEDPDGNAILIDQS
jgi:catechol 2,3-dioxygenase-like lactoylglutathione lyase family enzyme